MTVAGHLRPNVQEFPLVYPVTTEISKHDPGYQERMRRFYDAAALSLAEHLDADRIVAVICEGDPLFYGSYMHLHVRLAQRYPTEVVPGVSGFSGCWSVAGTPIAQGDDVFTVIPGTLGEEEIVRSLRESDAAVVMKLGRNLPKVRRALIQAGRLDRAIYVERGTLPDAVITRLADKPDDDAPYFALVLVPGWEARP
jgi:precorrin-2/cobalt-factor-2 C20-methyltransferase